jgi:hypothetical protein
LWRKTIIYAQLARSLLPLQRFRLFLLEKRGSKIWFGNDERRHQFIIDYQHPATERLTTGGHHSLRLTERFRRGGIEEDTTAGEESFMRSVIFIAALALVSLAAPSSADARGCLKGALVGGVAGHYAGHHGVLGAIGGCAVGHHMANEKDKEGQAASDQTQHIPNQPHGD